MEINGLPAHNLIIHLTVVFIPLAALFSAVYAAVPRWRWATRWPMLVSSMVALVSVIYAWFSGRHLRDERLAAGLDAVRFQSHQERADILLWVTVVFVALVLFAAWALGGPSALVSGRGARGNHAPVIEWTAISGLLILAVLLITMTVYTGEAGARLAHGG